MVKCMYLKLRKIKELTMENIAFYLIGLVTETARHYQILVNNNSSLTKMTQNYACMYNKIRCMKIN